METDLEKALKELHIKKAAVNAELDLTRECDSIIELDNRLGLLLKEIQSVRTSTVEQETFVQTVCDKLEPSHDKLKRLVQELDLCLTLQKLNRLCNQINGNTISTKAPNFLAEFEALYGPLERLLGARDDLPYAACALKLRSLAK